jgi:thiol-disulfide isomerase/thioredoxin
MKSRISIVVVVLLIVAAIGLYYATRTPTQPEVLLKEQDVVLGQFTAVSPPRPAPAADYSLADGTVRHLADFKGRWLLVNLWATWCAPCVKELPSLDRLTGSVGNQLAIVAIAEDRTGPDVVKPFAATLKLQALPIGFDQPGKFAELFKVEGLPTSLLIDPEGRLVGQLSGQADWDHPQTRAALQNLLAGKS